MPYVGVEEAIDAWMVDVAAIRQEIGPPPVSSLQRARSRAVRGWGPAPQTTVGTRESRSAPPWPTARLLGRPGTPPVPRARPVWPGNQARAVRGTRSAPAGSPTLGHLVSGAARNVVRRAAWLAAVPRATTRHSAFA